MMEEDLPPDLEDEIVYQNDIRPEHKSNLKPHHHARPTYEEMGNIYNPADPNLELYRQQPNAAGSVRKIKLSTHMVRKAINTANGDLRAAAVLLKVSLYKLIQFVRKKPMLRDLIAANNRQDLLMLAEANLRMLIMEGNLPATIFVLKTLGKNYYSERIELTPVLKKDINQMTDDELSKLVEIEVNKIEKRIEGHKDQLEKKRIEEYGENPEE
jgi:hypothetical protein